MTLHRLGRIAICLGAGAIALGGCPDVEEPPPPPPTTPAVLVGTWLYVGWLEDGVPRNLAEYYACTPVMQQCYADATTYAVKATKAFRESDSWFYDEYDLVNDGVYREWGVTTAEGDVLFLEVLYVLDEELTPSQRETERFTWEIASDTLVLTRVLDGGTTWVFKLILTGDLPAASRSIPPSTVTRHHVATTSAKHDSPLGITAP
jgi:hypothetical protein